METHRSLALLLPCLPLFAFSALHGQNIIATDEAVPAVMSEYATAENPAQYILGSSGPVSLDFRPDNYVIVGRPSKSREGS